MPDLDDIRSDLKSERIQFDSERFRSKLEILEGWVLKGGDRAEAAEAPEASEAAQAEKAPAAALSKTYKLSSPRAAMAFAAYVAQVGEDLGSEPKLHIEGPVVKVRNSTAFEDGTAGVAEADLDLALALDRPS